MKENQITKRENLDAALAGNAMYKREKLWRAAEGRSFPWVDLVALAIGALLIVGSLFRGYFGPEDAALQAVIGMIAFGTVVYRRQQARIDALCELVKLAEGN